MKIAGCLENVMPTINDLASKGISCSEAVTAGQPTQMAFPAIFTSTMPLDDGGYDGGIKNRKVALAEVLRNAGQPLCVRRDGPA